VEQPACRLVAGRDLVHPYVEGKGHLTKACPLFAAMLFAPFMIEHPISPAMKHFLRKRPSETVETSDGKKVSRFIATVSESCQTVSR
jgi:hypothetical protein